MLFYCSKSGGHFPPHLNPIFVGGCCAHYCDDDGTVGEEGTQTEAARACGVRVERDMQSVSDVTPATRRSRTWEQFPWLFSPPSYPF
jgi:hypothetical protein